MSREVAVGDRCSSLTDCSWWSELNVLSQSLHHWRSSMLWLAVPVYVDLHFARVLPCAHDGVAYSNFYGVRVMYGHCSRDDDCEVELNLT